MKKDLNPVMRRLSDFADSKGGFAEVGRVIGKHPSMFYNLVRRDAMPSLSTLTEIAEAFSDLDLNYIVRGEQSLMLSMDSAKPDEAVVDLTKRLKKMESERDALQSLYDRQLLKANGIEKVSFNWGAINSSDRKKEIRKEQASATIKSARKSGSYIPLDLPGRVLNAGFRTNL